MSRESEFIFGLRPVMEAIREGKNIERLLIKQGLQGQLYHELMKEVREHSIPFQIVPVEKIDRHTRKNHQGVLAFVSLIEYQEISNILPAVFEKGEDPLILCLDGITDVRNFGAIARSAECFGVNAILIPEKGSARITADALKTSAGALNNLPVCRTRSLTKTIRFLKESGLKVICADEKSNKKIFNARLDGPIVLVMGSEDRGISRELSAFADETVRIPLKGKTESLNVSVAAGIILYEITKQRALSDGNFKNF